MGEPTEAESLVYGGLGRIAVGLSKMDPKEALAWNTLIQRVLTDVAQRLQSSASKEDEAGEK